MTFLKGYKAYNELKKQNMIYREDICKLEEQLREEIAETNSNKEAIDSLKIKYDEEFLKHKEYIARLEEEKISLQSDIDILGAHLKSYRNKIVGIHDKYVKEYAETNWMPKSKYDELEQQLEKLKLELKWLNTKLDNLEKIPDTAKSVKELMDMRDSLYQEFLVRDKQGTPASDQMARELYAKINTIDWIVGATNINGKRIGEQYEKKIISTINTNITV